MAIRKDVYQEMNKLKSQSRRMREIAIDSDLKFDEANKIRKSQDDTYKKLMFYKNLVKNLERDDNKCLKV